MTVKVVQTKVKVCDCGSQFITGLYPAHEFTEPDEDGETLIAGVVPAWICPNCGEHSLVKKTEMNDWLFAGIRFQRNLVGTINIAERLAGLCPAFQAMLQGVEDGHTCNGCGDCDEEEDADPEPPKRNLH